VKAALDRMEGRGELSEGCRFAEGRQAGYRGAEKRGSWRPTLEPCSFSGQGWGTGHPGVAASGFDELHVEADRHVVAHQHAAGLKR
jgi:hypothetical protein